MRQQIVSGLLGVSLGLAMTWTASAKEKGASSKAQKTPAAEAASQASLLSPELSEREKALETWRAKLTGTRWELQLMPTGTPGGGLETDVLAFSQSAVGSDTLLKAGFPQSNDYALYSPTEQSVAWEAMQVKEEKGTHDMAIWRGEVSGETMQGTLVKQRKRGDKETTEQLSFTGHQLETTPEPFAPDANGGAPAGSSSATDGSAPADSKPAESPSAPVGN